ncbi:MAG: DEAD/DEAH box helicase [Bacteroidales bacterium]|nr:DEAD/DEAH box helicase [Bacteroidales bacterium]MCF8390686.1 DEAD/DEAH box helicase [Bacteroidales bacterium]
MKFKELNLNDDILEAISYMGFDEATPVQEKAIPEILNNRDLIACAQTGTGKTAAFILPILNKIGGKEVNGVNTLIIVPTRELAIQIDQQIQGLAYFAPVNSIALYGGTDGSDWDQQKIALTTGTHFVVATPGKLMAHIDMGYVNFSELEHLILDEADRMLDMGFVDDIKKIIKFLPENRQTLMFSATMPPKIRKLTSSILKNPVELNFGLAKPAEGVLQAAYLCYEPNKAELVSWLIKDKPDYGSILIFCARKKKVAELARSLKKVEKNVEGISSDLEQSEREKVLLGFRARNTRILVATDVMSRGIDIKDIDLVINYDVPGDAEDYVHRVGRTARAKGTGVAISLVSPEDMEKLDRIEKLIESTVYKMPIPSELGNSPEWNPGIHRPKKNFKDKKRKFFKS